MEDGVPITTLVLQSLEFCCSLLLIYPIESMYGIFAYIYHKKKTFMWVNIQLSHGSVMGGFLSNLDGIQDPY